MTTDTTPEFRTNVCCYCGRRVPVRAAHEDPGYDRACRALDRFLRVECPEVPADLRAKEVAAAIREHVLDGFHLDCCAAIFTPAPAATPLTTTS